MFKALLQYAVENGYEQIVLPEGSQYGKGPYSIAGQRTQKGLDAYYNKVFPEKMNKEVLAKAGIKDAKFDLSKTVPQNIKNPEAIAQEKQKFLDERQAHIDRTYPADDPDDWIQARRRDNIQRMNEVAMQPPFIFDPANPNHVMNYHVLPITESIKAAVKDPNNMLHSAFKRGGAVPGHAGGGFAGSTPWFTRQEARGMVPHGMLGGSGMGRTDNLPINVPSGAYVVPADIVSGIGQGNSHAGGSILAKAFGSGPLGMSVMHGHGGFGGPKNIAMGRMKMPMGSSIGSSITKTKSPGFQQGGPTDFETIGPGVPPYRPQPPTPLPRPRPKPEADYPTPNWLRGDRIAAHGGAHPAPPGHTPIVAASGEFIIHPDVVRRIGKGDLKKGHDVLDELMKDLRKKHVKELSKLPGPVKRARGGRVPSLLPDTRKYLDIIAKTLGHLS
jgi:hypothetical protein